MATENNHTVEVYDIETGEHYTRPATADELEFYAQQEKELAAKDE